jgi:hypothetical protein
MKFHELLRYLQKNEVSNYAPGLDETAELLEVKVTLLSYVFGLYSRDRATSPALFQQSNEYKWSLTEEGRKLLKLLNEVEYNLTQSTEYLD